MLMATVLLLLRVFGLEGVRIRRALLELTVSLYVISAVTFTYSYFVGDSAGLFYTGVSLTVSGAAIQFVAVRRVTGHSVS